MLLVRRSAPVASDGHVWTGRWGPAMSVTNGMARLYSLRRRHAEHRYQDAEHRQHSARRQRQVQPVMQAGFGRVDHDVGHRADIAGRVVQRVVDVAPADLQPGPARRPDEKSRNTQCGKGFATRAGRRQRQQARRSR